MGESLDDEKVGIVGVDGTGADRVVWVAYPYRYR